MAISTTSPYDDFPSQVLDPAQTVVTFVADPLPVTHAAESDTFARQEKIPGHDQGTLTNARIVNVGAGGIGSSIGMGLLRGGARSITIIDHDLVERTNLSRQLFIAPDLGQPKAHCLARNLVSHAVGGAQITGITLRFEQAVEQFPLPADLVIVGVDNNPCRHAAARWARRRRIPAVFSMLSMDGMRVQSFLQGPDRDDPCLWCALPNLDPEGVAPCAAAIMSTCFLAAAFAVFFAHRALMGWPPDIAEFNWREADLLGMSPDGIGQIRRRPDCPVCADLD